MSTSEVMTILVLFHLSHYREFKHFYLHEVGVVFHREFLNKVGYSRFTELERLVAFPLFLYLISHQGVVNGISYIDSTTLTVYNNRRLHSHKVFAGLAMRGKTSMGWFFGFKLHLVINEKGELVAFTLTPGNVDDRNPEVVDTLSHDLFGRLFGDRGYISKKLFQEL